MLTTSELTYSYDRQRVLRFPDLHCGSGEHWLLLGQSGSGKTTLLHLLGGLLTASGGHIKLDDHVLLKLTGFFPRWLYALQVWLSLPLMLYVDGVLGRAWRKLFTDFAEREQLPASAAKALRARRPSRSDVIGIERFVAKLRGAPLPGSRLLCAALSLATK